jgi:hypothetical protein
MRRLLVLCLAGCGSSTSGVPDASARDLAVVDVAVPGESPDLVALDDLVAPADLFLAPPGRLLAAGNLSLAGVTDDGQAIVFDENFAASAIDLASGKRADLGPAVAAIHVIHRAVFIWPNASTLAVWSAAAGTKPLSIAPGTSVAASADGAFIAWLDNLSPDRKTADLVVDRADHSKPHTLLPHADADCFGYLYPFDFVGGRLVARRACNASALTAWDPATGAAVDLLADAVWWGASPDGTKVVALDANYAGFVVPVAGGAPVKIAADFQRALFTSDGKSLVYSGHKGGLFRIAASGGNAAQLSPSSVSGLNALSPDGRFVTFEDGRGGVQLGSAVVAGPPIIALGRSPGSSYPDLFAPPLYTDDSRYALFNENGLQAQPTDGSWGWLLADRSDRWLTAGGARVVFSVEPTARYDLLFADLDRNAVTRLVGDAGRLFFLTPDRKALLFTVAAPAAAPGLYLAPLPP